MADPFQYAPEDVGPLFGGLAQTYPGSSVIRLTGDPTLDTHLHNILFGLFGVPPQNIPGRDFLSQSSPGYPQMNPAAAGGVPPLSEAITSLTAGGQMPLRDVLPGAGGPFSFLKEILESRPLVKSFDEVRHGEPVALRAFHGTNAGLDRLLEEGFKVPEFAEGVGKANSFNPQGKTVGYAEKVRGVGSPDAMDLLGAGTYFADVPGQSRLFGSTVVPIEVSLKKPFVTSLRGAKQLASLPVNEIRKAGYDGVIVQVPVTSKFGGMYGKESFRQGVAFYPETQVRAAFTPESVQRYNDPAAWRPLGETVEEVKQIQAAFPPNPELRPIPFRPHTMTPGAKIVDPKTGEVGTLRSIRSRYGYGREKPETGALPDFLEVRWHGSKPAGAEPRTDGNVPANTVMHADDYLLQLQDLTDAIEKALRRKR